MRKAFAGAVGALAVLIAAPAAQAVTPTTCSSLATDMNAATPGEVLQLPSGSCQTNVAVTNTAAFTLEGANTGGPTVLEPMSQGTPIIESSDDVTFTLSKLELTGESGAPALSLSGTGEGVTITNDSFTNNVGSGAIVVSDSGSANDPTVIENSTFSDNRGGEGGAIDWGSARPLTLTGNTFTGNVSTDAADGGGGVLVWNYSTSSTNAVHISDNTFGGPTAADGNTARSSGGGLFVSLNSGQPLTLTRNTFENNRISAVSGLTGNPYWRVGGGLFLDVERQGAPFSVTQSGNVFKDNVINEAASGSLDGPTGGAGEWITGLTVTSTGDSFISNRIAVDDGDGPPLGGGLGVKAALAEAPEPALPATFNARDDLFSDNSTASGGWGGGIYIGAPDPVCTSSCPANHITLDDSTVVGNRVAAGSGSEGGAIWGSPDDHLAVANSIIYGNAPKAEIYGFGSTSPTFAFSDVCPETGGPRISGSGLICANPLLGSTGAETKASPTIDAGSNALVPSGLTTDRAGNPRIVANGGTCATGPGPATVDMGAFEATFTREPLCNAKVAILSRQLTDTSGHTRVNLSCPDGYLYCHGTVTITTVKSYPIGSGKRGPLKLGSALIAIKTRRAKVITVELSRTALNKLRSAKSVRVWIAAATHDGKHNHASARRQVVLELSN